MIVGSIAAGRTIPELLADFPYLEEPDIREGLAYAAREKAALPLTDAHGSDSC
jgi:uncharacterized protein (DUF433 family)